MMPTPTVCAPRNCQIVDLRRAALARRIKTTAAVADLIAELAFGHSGSMADAIRTAPSSAGVR